MRPLRVSALAALGGFLVMASIAPVAILAASSSVECGQLSGYTAPDPVAPADGSLQIGMLPAWVILATATIGPNAGANLPSLGGPTCLAIDFDDDGAITSLEFAAQGDIDGTVDFDAGSGFYIFADRLIVPTAVTDAYPGLAALFVTSHAAGTSLSMTFDIDLTTGQFVGFDGAAAFCGTGSITAGGDGQVGDAVIPAEVLDAGDLAALAGAGSRTTCASVHSIGTIDAGSGDIAITIDVVIDVAAAAATPAPAGVTPPPTDVAPKAIASLEPDPAAPIVTWLGIVLAAALAVIVRGSRPARR